MPERSLETPANPSGTAPGVGHPTPGAAQLTLRAPGESDIARLIELAGDPQVARFLERLPHPYEEAHARAWLASLQQADCTETAFAIDDGTGLVGAISFRALDETPEIGYWLGRRYWGRGIMSRAARLALGWLFDTTPAPAVAARVCSANRASLAVLVRTGFRIADRTRTDSTTIGLRLERADYFSLA